MKSLILECFSWTPHLETAGEIALMKRLSGEGVEFGFLDVHNPDDDDCTMIAGTFLNRLGVRARIHKVRQLAQILAEYGVRHIEDPALAPEVTRHIEHFVDHVPMNTTELRRHRYQDADLGLGILSSMIDRTRHANPELTAYPGLVQEYARAAATVFAKARVLLLRARPDTIITFNGRFACSRGIAEAARQLGIPILYHERGALLERYELYERQPSNLEHWKAETRRHWEAQGDADIAKSFFKKQREFNELTTRQVKGAVPRLPGARQVVYFTSSDDEVEAVTDYSAHRMFPDQRAAILDLIEWVSTRSDTTLTIRVHPNITYKHLDDRNWWHSIAGTNVRLIDGDSEIDSYALMELADVVVTYGSTIGAEATYWDRPSVLLSDAEYAGFGCVYEPASCGEMHALLECPDLKALPRAACLPFGYFRATYGKPYRYYVSNGLCTGEFLGETLSCDRRWWQRVSVSPIGRAAKFLLRGNRRRTVESV